LYEDTGSHQSSHPGGLGYCVAIYSLRHRVPVLKIGIGHEMKYRNNRYEHHAGNIKKYCGRDVQKECKNIDGCTTNVFGKLILTYFNENISIAEVI
jgi:hypothetical protein